MALILSAIIGWAYPNVTDWFSLLGAFCGGFLNCYFPVRLFTVQFKQFPKRPWVNKFAWVWMILMMIILISAAVCVSIQIVRKIINGDT